MKDISSIVVSAVEEAEELKDKTGEEKKAHVIEFITKLDDLTPLRVIPNGLEEVGLSLLIDFTVAMLKKFKKKEA